MSLFVNRRVRIIPEIVTIIKRHLPSEGKITASLGQEVSPSDILGSSAVSAGYRNVKISELLEVNPGKVKKYLQRSLGQKIYQGEILAYKPQELLSNQKIVKAPSDGVLDSYNDQTGELRLHFIPHQVELTSGFFGIVEKVDQPRGEVWIKTQVAKVFGLVGCGRERGGVLKILGDRGDLIDKNMLPPDEEGHILVGGALIYKRAIGEAINFGINGIITGGLNSSDFKSISGGSLTNTRKFGTDIGIGLVVTEGFGSIPIGEDIFELLKSYNNQFVILDGNKAQLSLPACNSDCMQKVRGTVLPPGVSEQLVELEAVEVLEGQKVRVVGSPFLGEQGQVEKIDQTASLLPSGIKTFLVTIKTKSRKIRIPLPNLEVIN